VGLILDSSIVIAAERREDTVPQLLRYVASIAGDQPFALSAIGLTELAHGIARAHTSVVRQRRELFIHDLLGRSRSRSLYKAHGHACRGNRRRTTQGVTIPFDDLLIGATALEHGYSVATVNIRHFRLIPGLTVIQL
jgi:predicted nucleic acid-binding protein